MADSESVDLVDLGLLIAELPTVALRLALLRSDAGWEVSHGEVTLNGPEKTPARTWLYPEVLFMELDVSGPTAAMLIGGKERELAGMTIRPPATVPNARQERVPGQQRWNDLVTPWPRTEWAITRQDSTVSRRQGLLVGDGPTFLDMDEAVSAFFDASPPSRMGRTRPAWRVVRHEQQAWIHRVTISATRLVVRMKGADLAGSFIELTSPAFQERRPVGRSATVTFRLRGSLPAHTMLTLRTGDRWLDFRFFGDLTPGQRDSSVEWEQQETELELLLAGGEGQHVEFKESLLRDEATRRKAMRTVAAFASWNSGIILIGISDEGSIVGVPAADKDKVAVAITTAIRTNVTPEPEYAMRWIEHEGRHVLAIEVVGRPQWHAFNPTEPKFYVRRGATTLPAKLPEIAQGFGSSTAVSG